nr:MAG TPA: holin [Caudoviricetes sp.]
MNKFVKKLGIKVVKTMSQAALGVIGSSALFDGSQLGGSSVYNCTIRRYMRPDESI